jgi:RNA polymerase sigma-70 factor, ECF subfamily
VIHRGTVQASSSNPTSDAQVVASLHKKGDAVATLMHRYERLVYNVAAHILRDPAEAEDITQEIFFEIYLKSSQYDPSRGSVRVWLMQYAYHRSIRRKQSLQLRACYAAESLRESHRVTGDCPRDLTPVERAWFVRAGLSELTPYQQRTMQLVCFQEVPLRDAAERLRVSVGNARHFYYRGLERLRRWAMTSDGCKRNWQ